MTRAAVTACGARDAGRPAARPLAPATGRDEESARIPDGPGTRLDAATLRWAQRAYGTDMGSVRLHAGPAARRFADARGAAAYTVGDDVVLGAGGQRVLSHELAHVVQQRRGGPWPGPQHELGADRAAAAAARGERGVDVGPGSAVGIARAPRTPEAGGSALLDLPPKDGAGGADDVASMGMLDRIKAVLLAAGPHMPGQLWEQVRAVVFTMDAVMGVAVFIAAHGVGWGQAADAVGMGFLYYKLGSDAIDVGQALYRMALLTAFARSRADLEKAGALFARAVTLVGVDILLFVLAVRGRSGKGASVGKGVADAAEGTAPPAAGSPTSTAPSSTVPTSGSPTLTSRPAPGRWSSSAAEGSGSGRSASSTSSTSATSSSSAAASGEAVAGAGSRSGGGSVSSTAGEGTGLRAIDPPSTRPPMVDPSAPAVPKELPGRPSSPVKDPVPPRPRIEDPRTFRKIEEPPSSGAPIPSRGPGGGGSGGGLEQVTPGGGSPGGPVPVVRTPRSRPRNVKPTYVTPKNGVPKNGVMEQGAPAGGVPDPSGTTVPAGGAGTKGAFPSPAPKRRVIIPARPTRPRESEPAEADEAVPATPTAGPVTPDTDEPGADAPQTVPPEGETTGGEEEPLLDPSAPIDDRIAQVQRLLERQWVLVNKARKDADEATTKKDKKRKGRIWLGTWSRMWTLFETRAVLRRVKAFPQRTFRMQETIEGVQIGDTFVRTKDIPGVEKKGRRGDSSAEDASGGRLGLIELKSRNLQTTSIAKPKSDDVDATFRPRSQIGLQLATEKAIIDFARKNGGKIRITGTNMRTGESETRLYDGNDVDISAITDYDAFENN